MKNIFGSDPQSKENSYLHLLAGESGQHRRQKTVEGDRMNSGVSILPLPSANDLQGGRMSR